MPRVLLVSTIHEEQGLANISELHAILESIRPEVVFLEIPEPAFPDYNDGVRSNLESNAVRRYGERNDVVLVPVDLPTPDASFFRDLSYLDRRVTAASAAYSQLIDKNSYQVASYGFPYLNSQQSSQAWSDIYGAMHAAIQRLAHDSRLAEIFEDWKHRNDLRESAMLQKIDKYFLDNPFDNGVLLVGAAHRQPILEKSWDRCGTDALRIESVTLNVTGVP